MPAFTSRILPAKSFMIGYETNPAVMPMPRLYVKHIRVMVMKAGMSSDRSSKLMSAIGLIMSIPTMMSAGPYANGGITEKRGAKKRAESISNAVTTDAKPDRAPLLDAGRGLDVGAGRRGPQQRRGGRGKGVAEHRLLYLRELSLPVKQAGPVGEADQRAHRVHEVHDEHGEYDGEKAPGEGAENI